VQGRGLILNRALSLKPSTFRLFHRTVDGKLWANLFTKLAGYTSRRFNHKGRMIPLTVEGIRHFQNATRAVFNA
jgi:hypothetical protein